MATDSSRYGEAVSTEDEKERHVPQVTGSSVDGFDLPKGYFLRPFFLGTLLASGLSVSAVRKNTFNLADDFNSG